MMQSTIVLLSFIAASVYTLFYAIKTRHTERMARIEHGLDEPDPKAFRRSMIQFGSFFVSLAAALLFSYILAQMTNLPDHVTIPGSLLLFGGLTLILLGRSDCGNNK